MTPFEVVEYDASLRDDYLRLLHEAWGEDAIGGDVFDWWIEGIPEGTIATMAVLDGEIVGATTHSLLRAHLRGVERQIQYSVLSVTSERARGLGVWRSLTRRCEELGLDRGSAVALTFANDLTEPLFLGPLEWERVGRRRVWARPLRGLVRRRSRGRGVGEPRGDWHDGVLRVTRFGPEHDGVYEGLRGRLGDHVVRDHRYLNWRYVDSPRGYTALASGDGYAVLGSTQRRGLTLALLMDLVAPPEHVGPLLRACVAAAGGAAAMLALPMPCLPKTSLARHGFAPTHERLDLLGYGLAESLDARAERWTYTFGETDFF